MPADRCHIKPVCLVRSASRSARAISGATPSQFQKTSLINPEPHSGTKDASAPGYPRNRKPQGSPRARAREGVGVLQVQPAFADKMPAIIGQVDRLVWAHMDAMRPRVLPLAPGAQEVAVAVKHHHRVFAPVEAVDVVVIVDADCRHLLE